MKLYDMLRVLVCCLTYFIASISMGQGVEKLRSKNGFKDIKLASNIADYEGLEYKKDVKDKLFQEVTLYTAKSGHYESIGDIKIYDLQVKTYKDSIYQIIVITEKHPDLYKGLKKNFGEPKYDLRRENYYWSASTLTLTYTSHSKNKIEMIYFSNLMVDKRKVDKSKKIEEIADDF